MSKKNNNTIVAGIALIAILCICISSGNNTTTPQVIKTPTKTASSRPTKTPYPQISMGAVLVNSLNIRGGPGTNFPVIGSMKQGDNFYILADTLNSDNIKWFLIPLPDDSFGWVIGEQSYVTDVWVTVDYSTFLMVADAGRRAKLTYGMVPTIPPGNIDTQQPVKTQFPASTPNRPIPTSIQPDQPQGVTAICADGSYSYSQHRQGTCSHHGGVKQWINRPPN